MKEKERRGASRSAPARVLVFHPPGDKKAASSTVGSPTPPQSVRSVLRIHRFRLDRVEREDARWLAERLDGQSRRFVTRVTLDVDHRLRAVEA